MGKTRSILLVEDDEDIRIVTQACLEEEGYTVQTMPHGRAALDWLKTLSAETLPQLILLDLITPVLDGAGFRKEQLIDPKISQIPVVIISADGQVDKRASSIGITDTLKKPVDLDILINKVASYC